MGEDYEPTKRQRRVLDLLADGLITKQIATELDVEVSTVEAHLTRLYRATGQQGHLALAQWWRRRRG